MEWKICVMFDTFGSHGSPRHVPRRDRQTLPSLYRFGLNLTDPPPVVAMFTSGGTSGVGG